jgi:hypothetical protein
MSFCAAPAVSGMGDEPVERDKLIDRFLPKPEEWVERSHGKIRGDVAFTKLQGLGFTGSDPVARIAGGRPGGPTRRPGAAARARTAVQSSAGWLFDLLTRLTSRLLGPEVNRRTEENLARAGLRIIGARREGIWRELRALPPE